MSTERAINPTDEVESHGPHTTYPGGDQAFGTADYDDHLLLGPVNWNLLTAEEAMVEWADLNAWVDWLRHSYGLPPSVIPPYWHRHDELIWELSALHTHWLNAYDPDGTPSGPIGWHRDFADARHRLREWVSTAGTRLDHDRPTRQTSWPGEPAPDTPAEVEILDRDADFLLFVHHDVATRRAIEERVLARTGDDG